MGMDLAVRTTTQSMGLFKQGDKRLLCVIGAVCQCHSEDTVFFYSEQINFFRRLTSFPLTANSAPCAQSTSSLQANLFSTPPRRHGFFSNIFYGVDGREGGKGGEKEIQGALARVEEIGGDNVFIQSKILHSK